MPLTPGTRLGPYQIGEPLGAGGMGEVYRARDTRLDRSVAIKVMPPELSAIPELQARFDREARTISSLNHPHICALFDIGVQDGVGYLVMEYLEGETLADRLGAAATRALKLDEALEIAIQIADALDKAHRQGVVHRDLKPGNIMLTKSGAKLLDFGLARQAQPPIAAASGSHSMMPTDAHARPLTMQGTILGTLQYMAPEQLEGREADVRTDVFAFGALVYEMVTGRRAFEGKSQVSLIAAIVDHDPPPVSATAPVSPPLLDHLVRACLAKNPDRRWQSMADVLLQLRLIVDSGGQLPASLSPGALRQLRVTRIAAGALAVLTIGLVALTAFRRPDAGIPLPRLQFDVETPNASSPNQIALSPTGRFLAAQVSGSGAQLWVRALENANGQLIAGTDGVLWPFWSPDSRFVAFFADGKLKKVDLQGAPPQTLADAPSGTGGAWNQEDVIVFAPENAGPLFLVPAAGGAASPLTALDKERDEIAHRHPRFLPDGRRFLYTAVSSNPEDSAIYVASLDAPSERTRLVASAFRAGLAPPDRLLFMRDNTLMAQAFDPVRLEMSGSPYPVAEDIGINLPNSAAGFTVSDTGMLAYRGGAAARAQANRIMWFDRTGKAATALESPADYGTPALAPGGRYLAVSKRSPDTSAGTASDIWLLDLVRGTDTRLTFDPAIDRNPRWSPDGTRIAFRSARNGGTDDLYVKGVGGVVNEEVLLRSNTAKIPEDWSPDGRLLLYQDLDSPTRADLWVVPVTGDRKPQVVVQSPFNDGPGRFSADGKWIAYVSNESGRGEVYIIGFPAVTARVPISTAGGTHPRWRADGRELFYVGPAAAGAAMMAVDLAVAADGTLQAGLPRKLFETPMVNSPEVTPDGKRFLINVPVESAADRTVPITVVVNWNQSAAP
jgi:serine/threonine protein kinase/Tol biopolymer transport system component